jgi:hypothetical protein
MRLDPKKVRFVLPTLHLGLRANALRFVGRENTVQLSETALVVEGNLLKVGLLGIELLFRRALAEWSSVTIPYSRVTRARLVRFPLLRLMALLLFCVCGVCTLLATAGALHGTDPNAPIWAVVFLVLSLGSGYVVARIPPRFVITFRSRDGRRTVLMFQVTSRPLRREFDRKLAEYREAADRFATRARPPAADPVVRKGRRGPPFVLVALVLTAFLFLVSMAGVAYLNPDALRSADGLILTVIGVGFLTAAGVALLLAVPRQAYQRGHGFLSWFVLQIVAANPLYPLILLATLPNRARARLREEFARELDRKLSRAGRPAPDRTDAAVPGVGTVGDLPTTAPPAGSIGDEATRP